MSKIITRKKPQTVLARTYRLREKLVHFVQKQSYESGISQTKYIESLITGAMSQYEKEKKC
jgi:hypothetical protein